MNGAKLTEHSYIGNKFVQALEYLISPEGMFYMSRIVWAGDYAESEENEPKNLYLLTIENSTFQVPPPHDTTCYRYILNHTKQMYVDKERVVNNSNMKSSNTYSQIDFHPLPLLVSEGNGYGGGDYRGNNVELCGTWSRDVISVEKDIPQDYTELICNFYEE